jgi:hypothetical protein
MNRDWVLYNLREAHKELQRMISAAESTPDYDVGEFMVGLYHLYHHVNTAWNSRDESEAVVRECSDENFYRWRQFPIKDIPMEK